MRNIENIDVIWMHHAIIMAYYASFFGEVSVGAVLIYKNRLISWGCNLSIINHDPSAHAEIVALRRGGKILNNYRLLNTTLYVTLEPCIMCLGAMLHARIYRLVCGTNSRKNGICLTWLKKILNRSVLNHHIQFTTGILKVLCSNQLNNFFKCQRQ